MKVDDVLNRMKDKVIVHCQVDANFESHWKEYLVIEDRGRTFDIQISGSLVLLA